MKQTIALFGGSFNPPTRAHRLIINRIQAALPGVPLVLLPAPRVAHKDPRTLAPFPDRMAMMELLTQDMDNVTVSDFSDSVQSAQTVELLDAYRIAMPDTHFVWVMGADSFVSLPQWDRWTDIIENTSLYVLARNDQVEAIHHTQPAQDYAVLECKTAADITSRVGWYMDTAFTAPFSATAVRNALASGEPSPFLTDTVADYINAHGLYRK